MSLEMFLVFFWLSLCGVDSFWPPSYQIHLNDSETFIISDVFDGNGEDFRSDEEELFRNVDGNDDGKFFGAIHKVDDRKSVIEDKRVKHGIELKFVASDYPAYAGFVNEKGDIVQNANVYYANEMVKSMVEKRINESKIDNKREDSMDVPLYDYNTFKKEYEDTIAKEKESNNVLKYTNTEEEENFKDAIKNLITTKEVKNCTAEEMRGIGFQAIKCFINDLINIKNIKNPKILYRRIAKLISIWFLVYAAIAIPFWCQKGWCCCCFRFLKVCNPRKTIEESKQFLMINPPGVLNDQGIKLTYPSTYYEKIAQKQLERAIMKL